MFNVITSEMDFAGKKLVLEYGRFARQADSAIMVSYGKTKILCTIVAQKGNDVINDFFPLSVAYMERYHAAGKIPGGFLKRETKPNENEVLISRLIDRSIRPIFDEKFLNEVQISCTVFSYDPETTTEFIALLGAVAAIRTTHIPFYETVAGTRIARIEGKLFVNPTNFEMSRSDLDIFVSSAKNSILMVECEAFEVAESDLIESIKYAMEQNSSLIDFIDDFAGKVNGALNINPVELPTLNVDSIVEKIDESFVEKLKEAFATSGKTERSILIGNIKSESKMNVLTPDSTPAEIKNFDKIFKDLEKKIVRNKIVSEDRRIDGRNSKTVRPIECELSILPMAHGSALFTRGETQALVSITLGGEKDEQMVETMATGLEYDRFTLHYNFPGFSVGEIARFGAPGRREIGHGNLAKKALRPLLPSRTEYPFAIRCVSDILESNGSSSMATVCGVSLGLLSAGVPMIRPVSGIAMGLVKEGDNYVILSDIMGDEDALGDMDFKVAGTNSGVTALQMDIKIRGITPEILEAALEQAKEGRIHILQKMLEAKRPAQDADFTPSLPKIKTITVPENMIRLLIGVGGSVIKDLCAKSGASIDIAKQGGVVKVSSTSGESIELALKMIDSIVNPPREETPDVDEGVIYNCIVRKILDGYLIVKLENGATGYIYGYDISYSRFDKIEDVVRVGENVKAKVLSVRDKEEIKLSLKFVDQETGKDLSYLYNRFNEKTEN